LSQFKFSETQLTYDTLLFQDEVLAITEKVVLRVEDLLTWITEAADWGWGRGAVWERDCDQPPDLDQPFIAHNPIGIDMEDVRKEKQQLGTATLLFNSFYTISK
jgi:hypothetical protein